ncbi:hypothetical protein D3C87_105680 [compost metagenome]
MRYTHIDLSELCQLINNELLKYGGKEKLMVKANGGTTSIFKVNASEDKLPLLEDVARDEGYRFLEGFEFALGSK